MCAAIARRINLYVREVQHSTLSDHFYLILPASRYRKAAVPTENFCGQKGACVRARTRLSLTEEQAIAVTYCLSYTVMTLTPLPLASTPVVVDVNVLPSGDTAMVWMPTKFPALVRLTMTV